MSKFYISHTNDAFCRFRSHYQTPCIPITQKSNCCARIIAPIANGLKKATLVIALVIATLFTAIADLLALPFRVVISLHNRFDRQYKRDLQLLNPQEQQQFAKEIHGALMKAHTEALAKNQNYKSEILQIVNNPAAMRKLLASYARSTKVYGPVARAFTDHLLNKAHQEGRKLVFSARDGIPYYRIAKKLMATPAYQAKYPSLVQADQLALAFFSRKVIAGSSPKLLEDYSKGEVGLKDNDRCLIVDIGFIGSMIGDIRKGLPFADINFEYLISHTPNAGGFMGSPQNKLSTAPDPLSAGGHEGIHWLEDTHQGNIASAVSLVSRGGRIYPNSIDPQNRLYCSEQYTLEHFIRKFSRSAVVRTADGPEILSMQLPQIRQQFNNTLQLIKTRRLPLFASHNPGTYTRL